MASRCRVVTVWSKGNGAEAQWVIERSFQLHYVTDILDLPEEAGLVKTTGLRPYKRNYAWFERGHDPNIPKEKQ